MKTSTTRSFSFAFFAVSIAFVLSLAAAEILVRWQRPQYSYQAQALRDFDSHRLLMRPSYGMTKHPHPDKDELVSVRYDQNGLRLSSGPSAYKFSKAWGFFGDSYVENLRIHQDELFTSHLALALQDKQRGIFNFGVEGYGPDQSYLAYLDFPEKDRLKKVFYVFCHNDLANLSQNKIFDLQGGQLVAQLKSEVPLWKRFIGQFYLTYFVLDQVHQWQGRNTKKFFDADSAYTDIPWLGSGALQLRYLRRERKALDVGLKELKLLKAILKNWRAEVEERGGEFEVVVLPDRRSDEMAQGLQTLSERWHFSRGFFLEEFEQQEDWTFENDDHWNELAQKRFADFLLENFKP